MHIIEMSLCIEHLPQKGAQRVAYHFECSGISATLTQDCQTIKKMLCNRNATFIRSRSVSLRKNCRFNGHGFRAVADLKIADLKATEARHVQQRREVCYASGSNRSHPRSWPSMARIHSRREARMHRTCRRESRDRRLRHICTRWYVQNAAAKGGGGGGAKGRLCIRKCTRVRICRLRGPRNWNGVITQMDFINHHPATLVGTQFGCFTRVCDAHGCPRRDGKVGEIAKFALHRQFAVRHSGARITVTLKQRARAVLVSSR